MASANISKRLAALEASANAGELNQPCIVRTILDSDGYVLSAHMRLGQGVIVPVKQDQLESIKQQSVQCAPIANCIS